MPSIPNSTDMTAGWWANFLLDLGSSNQYDLLMYYLNEARERGCLNVLRLTTQQVVLERAKARKGPSVKKASNSGFVKAA